jgi:hypothetical protein
MTTDQARHLIHNDDKFVYSKRFEYDLDRLVSRYPEECPDRVIAAVLMITEDDVESEYERIARKLRMLMGVGE